VMVEKNVVSVITTEQLNVRLVMVMVKVNVVDVGDILIEIFLLVIDQEEFDYLSNTYTILY